MFYPSYTNETFEKRKDLLKQICEQMSDEQKKVIKFVPTHFVKTQKENDKLYRKYLDKKYEGVMIRNPEGPYAKSAVKKSSALRSKDLLKRKEVYDGEYEVVDFTSGKMGKDVDALIWICQTPTGDKFNVVPNLSYKERYSLYKDCQRNFVAKYKNRMITVEYRSFSDDGIPNHAKAVDFRIDT
jgi:DNA ligase-1